ncbi:zinc finger protein 850-like [Anopheles maculipalpis]|uniref:zinc finger protein 850-like n=1 Tax=Anopheles maculipalpis TaxID=1496333 RepID=UPI002158DD22|nr:zinc finger protein 850-like [Anopheles maculipalpis]
MSKRRKISNADMNEVASTSEHHGDGESIHTKCCICSKHPKGRSLLELCTVVESDRTIASIVEQVAGIKIKHVQKSICNACWTKIQAAYTIQKEIRDSECIEEQDMLDDYELDEQLDFKDEFNTKHTDDYDEDQVENAEDVIVKQETAHPDDEYVIEYLEENVYDNDEEQGRPANDNDPDIAIEISANETYEEPTEEYGKVTRVFKMPVAATIVSITMHDQYRVVEVTGERCCGCSFVAQTRKELLQHSETVHCVEINDHGDYCPICFYKFATDQELEQHIQEFKANKMYVCLRCNYFFNVRGHLIDHIASCYEAGETSSATGNGSVTIERISKEEEDEDDEYYLQQDAADAEDEQMPSQSDGGGHTQNASDPRVMHRYRALFEEILSNDQLSSPLTELELNVQEIQITAQHVFETFKYVRLRGLRCCGCSYTCYSSALLLEHGKTSHPMMESGGAVGNPSCQLCWTRFPNETELVKHLCFFTTKQLFFCTVCDESFLNHESLRHHQLHNEQHRDQLNQQFQQAGIEMLEPFVELDQPPIVDELGKLLAEKVSYRPKIIRCIPMPATRFIKNRTEYNNYSTLTVVGEYCCGCAKFFDTLAELRVHAKTEHYLPLDSSAQLFGHQCEFCYAVFDYERGLFMHNACRRTKEKTLHECKLCGMLFSKKFCLARHMQSAPNHLSRLIVDANLKVDRDEEREEDSEASSSAPVEAIESDPRVLEALQLHRSVEEKGLERVGHLVWYHCCFPKCPETFTSEEALLAHAQDEHNGQRRENNHERKEDTNVCPACCKSFQTLAKLMWHRVKRFVPRKYPCKQCDKIFNQWVKLKMHVELEHNGTPPNFPCPQCGKSFIVRSRLKAHLKTHSERKEHACDVCDASFHNKGLLKRHRRALHSTELLFECKHCSKKFAVVEKFKIHQRVHTGERPFECTFCPRTFLHFSDRKRHEMATHTGERPFKCKLCTASYIRNRELNLHMQKHRVDGSGKKSIKQ